MQNRCCLTRHSEIVKQVVIVFWICLFSIYGKIRFGWSQILNMAIEEHTILDPRVPWSNARQPMRFQVINVEHSMLEPSAQICLFTLWELKIWTDSLTNVSFIYLLNSFSLHQWWMLGHSSIQNMTVCVRLKNVCSYISDDAMRECSCFHVWMIMMLVLSGLYEVLYEWMRFWSYQVLNGRLLQKLLRSLQFISI